MSRLGKLCSRAAPASVLIDVSSRAVGRLSDREMTHLARQRNKSMKLKMRRLPWNKRAAFRGQLEATINEGRRVFKQLKALEAQEREHRERQAI